MVEPTDAKPVKVPGMHLPSWRWTAIVCALVVSSANGCGFASRTKVDEFQRVAQNLRAENSRLRDVALDLRSRNQDLNQRAVVDARRITAQQEAVEQLEESVQGYQAEREKMAAAYDTLERQVRLAVSAHPETSARARALDAFANAHPGWIFDASRRTLIASTDLLFEAGRDRLTTEAETALQVLAKPLAEPGAKASSIEIAAYGGLPSPVQKAGYEPDAPADSANGEESADNPAAKDRFLAAARAARVRERLAAFPGLDLTRVRLVPASAPEPVSELPPPQQDPGALPDRRIEIRLPREFFEPEPHDSPTEDPVG